MIIWKGWGILTVLFAVIGLVAGSVIGSIAGALIGGIVGGAVAAVLNHLVAKAVTSTTVVIDPVTQQQILLKKSSSFFFIPMQWFSPIFLVGGIFIGFTAMQTNKNDKQADKDFPGKAVFEKADDLIDSNRGGVASYGNTPNAEKAAASFSASIKKLQSMSFEMEGSTDKYSSKDFLTYCHEGKDGITFMCHVPGMRKYKDAEAKKAIADIGWVCASTAVEGMPNVSANTNLVVGLRGLAIYDSIQEGKVGSENPSLGKDQKVFWKIFEPMKEGVAE